jgi:hypothetical protein
MRPRETISRLTAVVPQLFDPLWRAAREIEEAQTAAWLPLADDDA